MLPASVPTTEPAAEGVAAGEAKESVIENWTGSEQPLPLADVDALAFPLELSVTWETPVTCRSAVIVVATTFCDAAQPEIAMPFELVPVVAPVLAPVLAEEAPPALVGAAATSELSAASAGSRPAICVSSVDQW